MQTIATLKGPEFLRACNRTRHAVEDFLTKTQVLDLRKVKPLIPEDATDDQRKDLLYKQARKNIAAMLDRVLDQYPEETYALLCTLIIPDPGEELDGFDLISAGLELACTPKVIDFFTRLVRSVQEITDD